jgi:hypothetical protein
MVAPEMDPVDPQVEGFRDLPLAYQFYRGVELHPRFLGVGKDKLWLCFFALSLGTSLYNIWHLVKYHLVYWDLVKYHLVYWDLVKWD